jgi:hypothetical protein
MIDKNNDDHLLYVACENSGGLFIINLITGEQKLLKKDIGNEINPQMVDNEIESVYFDDNEKKLYVCSDTPTGGVWVKDYESLVPDYGDLRLQSNSPAIDLGNQSVIPPDITLDIMGLNRFVNYTSIQGDNSLDLGAYEKTYECLQPLVNFQYEKLNGEYVFTPILSQLEQGCNIKYNWDFGDGSLSTEAGPMHTFSLPGTYNIALQLSYSCGTCPTSVINKNVKITVENSICGDVYCDKNGGVGIGATGLAQGYKLSVKGKVIMEGGKIMGQSKWPDYVFDPGYNLISLVELKTFIDTNKHLPDLPSAQQTKTQGIDIGEMSALLLKKTEELTLYFIQLDERLKKLENLKSIKKK